MRQDEHRKMRQRQFVRAIEEALRPVLLNQKTPLVLAGVDTMLTYYREVDTYPHTEGEAISGNQEHRRADEFAAEVRAIVSRGGSRAQFAIVSIGSKRCVTTGAVRPT
jgi:hypothetical protein